MNIQVCATISKELNDEVVELSQKENRTFSQMVSLLLQLAVKEKTRKRNGRKSSISNNTTNSR